WLDLQGRHQGRSRCGRRNDPDDAELPVGRGAAAVGGERDRQRSRRRRRECQSGLGAGVVTGSNERRGAPCPQYVVSVPLPKLTGVIETALYVEDIARARAVYE